MAPPIPGNPPPVGCEWRPRWLPVKVGSPNCEGVTLRQASTYRLPARLHGFTLVELAVTMAVIGILAAVAVPSMTSLVRVGRLNGAASELTTALQLARAEAIRRNAQITACATDGSESNITDCVSSASWGKWAILNRGETTNKEDRVLRTEVVASSSVQISGPSGGIVFRPSGLIDDSQQLEVDVDDNKRYICVQISGVVTVKKEPCS